MQLESKVPPGPLAEKWDRHRFDMRLVNPANKRKYRVVVVGTGLAGASAAASLAELGYNVDALQARSRQGHAGRVRVHPRTEMQDLVVVDGRACGIVVRDLVAGKIETHVGDAVVLATGGYGPVFYLSTNAMGFNVTATYRA